MRSRRWRRARSRPRACAGSASNGGIAISPTKSSRSQDHDLSDQLLGILGQNARLLRLAADVDLDQHLLAAAGPVALEEELQALGDVGAIHRVDDVKGLQREPGLVALQRTDQVPGRGRDCGPLGRRFLDPVLTEVGGPGDDRVGDTLGGERLADGDQRDV